MSGEVRVNVRADIRQRRFGSGVELKTEYFRQAIGYCERAVSETHHQGTLMFAEEGAA